MSKDNVMNAFGEQVQRLNFTKATQIVAQFDEWTDKFQKYGVKRTLTTEYLEAVEYLENTKNERFFAKLSPKCTEIAKHIYNIYNKFVVILYCKKKMLYYVKVEGDKPFYLGASVESSFNKIDLNPTTKQYLYEHI